MQFVSIFGLALIKLPAGIKKLLVSLSDRTSGTNDEQNNMKQ